MQRTNFRDSSPEKTAIMFTPSGMAGFSNVIRFTIVSADVLPVYGFTPLGKQLGSSLLCGSGGRFDPGLIHSSAESLH